MRHVDAANTENQSDRVFDFVLVIEISEIRRRHSGRSVEAFQSDGSRGSLRRGVAKLRRAASRMLRRASTADAGGRPTGGRGGPYSEGWRSCRATISFR